jgi:hypothetical protein
MRQAKVVIPLGPGEIFHIFCPLELRFFPSSSSSSSVSDFNLSLFKVSDLKIAPKLYPLYCRSLSSSQQQRAGKKTRGKD